MRNLGLWGEGFKCQQPELIFSLKAIEIQRQHRKRERGIRCLTRFCRVVFLFWERAAPRHWEKSFIFVLTEKLWEDF